MEGSGGGPVEQNAVSSTQKRYTFLVVSASCTCCNEPLSTRENRQGGNPFIACAARPGCTDTERPVGPTHLLHVIVRHQDVVRRVAHAAGRKAT